MSAAWMSSLADRLFGSKGYTSGARVQLPRKIPLRVEPKTYFALERTYLAWMHMAITLGGVTSALVGFTVQQDGTTTPGGAITKRTSEFISLLLLPIAMMMIVYALFVFWNRSKFLASKQFGFYNDRLGPVVLCGLIMASLTFILGMSVFDYVTAN